MTKDEYGNIVKAFNDAQESDTPFLVPNEDEFVVVGDANKTEIIKHDYKIDFLIPTEVDGQTAYKKYTKKFENIYITPRQEMKILRRMQEIIPFFRKIDENGELHNYTEEEATRIFLELDEEIFDRLYPLVGTVLGINDSLIDYMTTASVLQAATTIFMNYPEMVNESETFFR